MKLITFYSDSHIELYNRFLSSFKIYLSNKYVLLSKKIEQLSTTGEYNSDGFDLTMIEKLTWIIDNIDINDNEPMIFSDCDVQFFSDLTFDLSNNDILFQHDYHPYFNYAWFSPKNNKFGEYPNYCAWFFICKQNYNVKNFFQKVKNDLIENLNGVLHDQTMMNKIINDGYEDIKHDKLDSNLYWTVGFATNGEIWDGQENIIIPKNIIMHHANFTIGINNKIKLMDLVKNKK